MSANAEIKWFNRHRAIAAALMFLSGMFVLYAPSRTGLSAQDAPRAEAGQGLPVQSAANPTTPRLTTRRARLDLRFVFDFTELHAPAGDTANASALKKACDSFAANTRDQVYPALRDITGVSLGRSYREVRYKIKPAGTMGGTARDNQITLDQRYSVDLDPPGDIHELIHVLNYSAGALHDEGDHLWHGALMHAVEVRLGWKRSTTRAETFEWYQTHRKDLETCGREKLPKFSGHLLGDQVTLLYFDHGEKALTRLYRSTIDPRPISKPSPRLVDLWGESASQVQALLETMRREYNFTFDKQTCAACGF